VRRSFEIVSVNVSAKVGEPKKPVGRIAVREGHGVLGDAHAGDWHRQVSLLAEEDIDSMRDVLAELAPGDFAENITTRGIDLVSLPIGTRVTIGDVELEVTQIGKECHNGCAIRRRTGDCVMPTRGVFARVVRGGEITDESTGHYDI
jgi:MOSC domain-containing protein YiiM